MISVEEILSLGWMDGSMRQAWVWVGCGLGRRK